MKSIRNPQLNEAVRRLVEQLALSAENIEVVDSTNKKNCGCASCAMKAAYFAADSREKKKVLVEGCELTKELLSMIEDIGNLNTDAVAKSASCLDAIGYPAHIALITELSKASEKIRNLWPAYEKEVDEKTAALNAEKENHDIGAD